MTAPKRARRTKAQVQQLEQQIQELDLPTKPRKEGDKRAAHIEHTVEAEAMPANLLRGLLRDAIESFLPPYALAVVKEAEQSERDGLRRLGAALQGADIHDAVEALCAD